jgi:hypothetical protein
MSFENIGVKIVNDSIEFVKTGFLNFDEELEQMQRKLQMLEERIALQPDVPIDHLSELRLEVDNLNFEKRRLDNDLKNATISLNKKINEIDIERSKRKKTEVRLSVLEGQLMELMGEE